MYMLRFPEAAEFTADRLVSNSTEWQPAAGADRQTEITVNEKNNGNEDQFHSNLAQLKLK